MQCRRSQSRYIWASLMSAITAFPVVRNASALLRSARAEANQALSLSREPCQRVHEVTKLYVMFYFACISA